MSKFDLKSFLINIAPAIATGLGGPLAGTAVSVLSDALTGKSDTPQAELEKLVSKGLNPEQIAAIKKVDNDFAIAMKEAEIDLVEINNAHEQSYLADTQNARQYNAGNDNILNLGIIILLTFTVILGLALYGSYELLTGGIILKDPSVVAAVFGLIGTLIGYAGANSQQVLNFYFGSSQGSANKTQALSDAIKQIGNQPKGLN